jgi:hypothetical protein
LRYIEVSNNQDPARTIAERVARRLAAEPPDSSEASSRTTQNAGEKPRARVIDFIASTAPPQTKPSIGIKAEPTSQTFAPRANPAAQVAQSPWLAPFKRADGQAPSPPIASHPSEERFGVEEAAVSELVEFFENEKQCSVDPSGKPCDHCAMCSSRGF